ncbi:barstar family protein [Pseudomonas alliivorans]|uniref:barstar family protein n=1 Tax=Pseudomonas alliivorans TaxID=2810613 RepID=UPI001AE29A65|nr:barstar family protein [Pseudomonas alliivorans]MBP0950315.1 barstar family protein [Pseudomonas alliivorans]MEE4307043.1 barstar family protein [Pseudomonas alliivorans]MEE4687914.1 barstar family protein [Pseudomonas alliivorans]MEE4730524.1 barstar family protein [Pseudomonas alliivorans]MEE5038764.1 barstar family protein [Pseudomonas alliivorans]
MTRIQVVQIDLGQVESSRGLHSALRDALELPDWYGCNWDAFWDSITGLVQMPVKLKISGWVNLSKRLPRDAELMKKCFAEMMIEYPELASDVEFD